MQRIRPSFIVFLSLFALTPFVASAVTVRFEDPCKAGKSLHEVTLPFDEKNATAGDATVNALQKWGVPYQGDVQGVQSILNTPTSLDAVEFESDDVFRVHGWCYQVDGVEPGVMAGEFKLSPTAQVIRWFFGYARYRAGNWEGYCNTDRTHTEYCKGRLGVRVETR